MLYGQLRQKDVSPYRVKLIVTALIQINYVPVMNEVTEDGFDLDLENARTRTLALFEGYGWRYIPPHRKEIIIDWIKQYDMSTDLPEDIPGLIPPEIIEKMKRERGEIGREEMSPEQK